IAMYGPVGYRYSGVVHPARPLTPRLEAILATVEAASGVAFNSVLANLYRDGRDSVGWHRDSDYAHGGQPAIASVSFGAVRRFQLRADAGRRPGGGCAPAGQPAIASVSFGAVRRFQLRADGGRSRAAIDLESGSVLLM